MFTNYASIMILVRAAPGRRSVLIHFRMTDIKYPLSKEDTLVEVFCDGTVVLAYLETLKIRCHGFDLSQFPFDQQTCSTRYGSWARSNEQIVLTTGKVIEEEKQFRNHSEWDIISFLPRLEDGKRSGEELKRVGSFRLLIEPYADSLCTMRITVDAHSAHRYLK